jgi:hypothetical protein
MQSAEESDGLARITVECSDILVTQPLTRIDLIQCRAVLWSKVGMRWCRDRDEDNALGEENFYVFGATSNVREISELLPCERH